MGTSQSKTEQFKQPFKKILEEKLSIYPPLDTQDIKTKCRKPTKLAPQTFLQVNLNAKPVEETNQNQVDTSDGRAQVLNASQWPYSVHGIVAVKFGEESCYGTGIMIGPNIVLTAGQNLYRFKDKTYADLPSIQFLPGVNGNKLPFGSIEVEEYFVSPNYIKEEKEDYGILILKEPIGDNRLFWTCLLRTRRDQKEKHQYHRISR